MTTPAAAHASASAPSRRWPVAVLAAVTAAAVAMISSGAAAAWAAPDQPTLSVDDPQLVLEPGVDAAVTFTVTLVRPELAGTGVELLPMLGLVLLLLGAGFAAFMYSRRAVRAGAALVVLLAAGGLAVASQPAPAQAAPEGVVTVNYHTDGDEDTAVIFEDASGTLTFGPTQGTATVVVNVSGSSGAGDFDLVLTDPSGAVLGTDRGTATVTLDAGGIAPNPTPTFTPTPTPTPTIPSV